MSAIKIWAVFDCTTYIQAMLNPQGVAGECLDYAKRGDFVLVISPDVIEEVTATLQKPNLKKNFPRLTLEQAEVFLAGVLRKAVNIRHVPVKFRYSRDPEDEPYLNLAIVSNADYIVSRDNDLLHLMTDYADECKEFRQRFRPLKVIEPIEFLQLLREQNKA